MNAKKIIFWNKKFECMPRKEKEKLQLERLKNVVNRCYKNSVYREKFAAAKIKPESIKTLDDLKKIPFTVKDDLRINYPFKMFTASMEKIIRLHASSGTTGKPIVVGYTRDDVFKTWNEVMARVYTSGGVTSKDVVQNAYGYGLFTGGLGFHYGAEAVGATVIPIASGNTRRQITLMQDFGTTVLCCTPSYALYIAEVAREMNVPRESLKLKVGFFGAEPWSEGMRKEIESKLKIDAIDVYGLSEVIGPGVACECLYKKGLHIFDDHFIPEIIDSKTGEVLEYGEKGELVFTTLTKEAFPVLRYRTKDIARLIEDECDCGRTHVRMERISGRTDDMLIIRGVNVFPSQIEAVITDIQELEPQYQLIVNRIENLDTLEVQVELKEEVSKDKNKNLEEIRKKFDRELESVLGLSAKITLMEPKTIPRSEGKAKRIIDNRKM